MFIYNKNKGYAINTDNIKDIFLGRDTGTVSAGEKNGGITRICTYDSEEEAKAAIEMLMEQMAAGKREVIYMPEPESVRTRLRERATFPQRHHVTGKKTKGHGGS